MNFVFYDLETSGLSSAYDQVLQFAAIVVDENFVELERVNLRCRLSVHILPNPIALAVTGVSPADLLDPNSPTEFEFAQQIRAFVNKWAPATWTGYNSIGFDEEHLRQLFFQTLQPNIYETQFNGNNRLDMLMVVQACRVKHPDALAWVKNDKNKISFKLDMLAPGNGFTQHNAHDALGDVEATIFIAQLIAENAPDLWARAVENRDKNALQAKVDSFAPIQYIQNHYGQLNEYSLCYCGTVQGKGVFFDIGNYDPKDYFAASDEDIRGLLTQRNSGVFHSVALNKAPSLYLDEQPSEVVQERAATLSGAHDFRALVCNVVKYDLEEMQQDKSPEKSKAVEGRIYEGFYDRADKSLLDQFQSADWVKRRDMLGELQDVRLKQLGRRLIMFQGDAAMSDNDKAKATAYLKDKWTTQDDVAWGTFAKVEADMQTIKNKQMLDEQSIADLEAYYANIKSKLESGQLL